MRYKGLKRPKTPRADADMATVRVQTGISQILHGKPDV